MQKIKYYFRNISITCIYILLTSIDMVCINIYGWNTSAYRHNFLFMNQDSSTYCLSQLIITNKIFS